MSNLLKQYYVTNNSGTSRIIDSNRRADMFIRERSAEVKNFEPLSFDSPSQEEDIVEDFDEFSPGIDAQEVEYEEPQVDVSEQVEAILAQAREEAENIIAEAEKKAEEIMVSANIRAENAFEESKKKGYEEGAEEKLADVMKMQDSVEEELRAKKMELEQEYQQKSDALESDIVDAIIEVFDRVFHIQFDDKKEMLLHLIKNTLMNVEVGKEFRIHVSQKNYKFINSHLDDLKQNIGNDVSIEVVNDASLGTEDCQIETNFGVFDCGIDMELNNLIKDIKSLCG